MHAPSSTSTVFSIFKWFALDWSMLPWCLHLVRVWFGPFALCWCHVACGSAVLEFERKPQAVMLTMTLHVQSTMVMFFRENRHKTTVYQTPLISIIWVNENICGLKVLLPINKEVSTEVGHKKPFLNQKHLSLDIRLILIWSAGSHERTEVVQKQWVRRQWPMSLPSSNMQR